MKASFIKMDSEILITSGFSSISNFLECITKLPFLPDGLLETRRIDYQLVKRMALIGSPRHLVSLLLLINEKAI